MALPEFTQLSLIWWMPLSDGLQVAAKPKTIDWELVAYRFKIRKNSRILLLSKIAEIRKKLFLRILMKAAFKQTFCDIAYTVHVAYY